MTVSFRFQVLAQPHASMSTYSITAKYSVVKVQ